jgi:hypothetical protein
MNARQKKFVLTKLIPFILREQGNGFAMSTWTSKVKGDVVEINAVHSFDNIERTKAPSCGTVACIGGSLSVLSGRTLRSVTNLSKLIGITPDQASGLFSRWEIGDQGADSAWPESFARRFSNADSPLAKARIAVSLLRRVVKTNGACLDPVDHE